MNNTSKNKLDKKAKSLMTCDLINSIVSLFGETFLVAYFLQITNDNIIQVSIYYIILYFLIGFGNFLLGRINKKATNRLKVYRFGIIFKSLYILSLVLLKEKISTYFILVAIFYGIAQAFYWSSHDVMNNEIVENEKRKYYMTTKRIISKLLNIAVPIILGTSIELTSFNKISIYIFILTLVQIIISLNIKIDKIDNEEQNYSMTKYFKSLTKEQKSKLKDTYILSFLYGVMMDVIRVTVIILIIMTFKTSFNLGVLTTIFSIFSMISLYIFNNKYKKQHAKKLLIFCASLCVFGLIGLLIDINKITIILYNLTYYLTVYILEVMFKIKVDNVLKEYNIEKWIIEYHTCIDVMMEVGRITGFILLIITALLNQIIYFKILLLIITISVPIYSYKMYQLEKE